VLYDMLTYADGPGYVCQLNKGMTTLAESWEASPKSSLNHCMLGHIEEWFYRGLGGLTSDPSGPGFKKIMIKPQIVGDLKWVECSYDSLYGQIISNWKRDEQKLTMNVTIPPNTTATVFVPAKDESSVTESGKPASEVAGVKFLRMENNAAVYAVGSGNYQFHSLLREAK
jgi:alpha-L-rhamnosidase